MNRLWINQKRNKQCILFFNGWGMDENAVNHLLPLDYDIYMFYDYNPITRIDQLFDKYSKIFLVAWSLGVWLASKVINEPKIEIKKSIALNGTLKPIDIDKGISPLVFASTCQHWDEENRLKFNRRMFGGTKQYENLKHHLSSRSVGNQKDELAYLQGEISSRPYSPFGFDCAYTGKHDMIFTHQNLINFWTGKTRIIEADSAHYPFSNFNTWEEIINL